MHLLPPAVGVLLVLFNRNHNVRAFYFQFVAPVSSSVCHFQYIAKKLLEINERGTWKDPNSIPRETPKRAEIIIQQEEEVFQTARLINCGWFRSVVFSDYFSAILGLVRQGNTWSLDPFTEFRTESHSISERGRGNVCSVEVRTMVAAHVRSLTTSCSSTVRTVSTLPLLRRMSDGLNNR